jgi:hypothetical protein
MPSASALRVQIESALAKRVPSALTPSPRLVRPVSPSGIAALDDLLEGGLPLGALTEIVGSQCSGRTSFALSFIAQVTKAEKVCAWIDVSDTLNPESAAAVGVELKRLLWVRCGVRTPSKIHTQGKPLSRIEQALRVTDLLLHGGGFSAIVLDMGSVTPEDASRVPLAVWFRYRAAAEESQASILLLTQHPCAKSSAELVLRLQASDTLPQDSTVFSGLRHHVEVSRQRFTQLPSNVVPLREPPQKATSASWHTRTTWAGIR